MALPAMPDCCTVTLADVSQTLIPSARAQLLLSQSETLRASTFSSPRRRWQYVQCHALLRELLSKHVDIAADQIELCEGEYGKPALSGRAAESGAKFNISHSGSLAVIAVGTGVDIGVDIEQIKPGRNILDIADHFFNPSETQAIHAMHRSEQESAFYSCWCRKESFIKATGMGLGMPLSRFIVNVEPEAAAELVWIDYQDWQTSQWQMHTLLTPSGYLGALTLGTDSSSCTSP
ncbi:MAG: 4'-phosphopantetheinyl transferase superfamily protein [Granulosicoccus sp.]